jgi:uncharacterized protein DUF5682
VTTTVLGVRHHGPGSARAVRAALTALVPDLILIEGPKEADSLVEYVGALKPPVAVLAHAPDRPGQAAFWPFADFSPEWQALTYATRAGCPVRFIDLPAAVTLAGTPDSAEPADQPEPDSAEPAGQPEPDSAEPAGQPEPAEQPPVAADPLAWLSRAAGHDDPERWWEDVVEHRLGGDPLELFAAIGEAMTELRAAATQDGWSASHRERQREAAMRGGIRAAIKAGHDQIAVICGAWHVPALTNLPTAKADAELLRGLPSVKTRATWVPWTAQRLTQASGYGAGVTSPGWYAHLWRAPDQVVERWMVAAASLLRAADLPASTAAALESVRLARALAAVRGRSLPGLTELTDAIQAVLCAGDAMPLQLITSKLIVGEELGEVPPDVPIVPLQADFEAECRRLRFRPMAADRDVELDLRGQTDRDRSRLLHRLALLDVPWGAVTGARGEGTFKESWRLRWQPEYLVCLIERARYGTSVRAAASAVVTEQAAQTDQLPVITRLVESVVLADLPDALAAVTDALEQRSARSGDVQQIMQAVPPLARVLRYGSVRQTDADVVRGVVDSLLIRVCAGLPAACASLDDDAATGMLAAIEAAHEAIALVGSPDQASAWQAAQRSVADLAGAPGLVAGRCVRLLLDASVLEPGQVQQRLARVLSASAETAAAVRWLEGFLRGSGLLLLRDRDLWQLFDDWLCQLSPDSFDQALPLLRRAFAQFTWPERRQMGELVRSGRRRQTGVGQAASAPDWDPARVQRILPVLAVALGRPQPGSAPAAASASGSPDA